MAIVLVLLLAAAAGFSRRVTSSDEKETLPTIPHPVDETTAACGDCHQVGEDGMPRSHQTYGVSTCLTCHRVIPTDD